jgi:hypothetical protein
MTHGDATARARPRQRRKRLLASYFSIDCSVAYRPHEFVPACDTIAVTIEPLCPRFPKPNEPATSILALREAIEIWHAVSSCRGFGFHENTEFWKQALRLKFESKETRVRLSVTKSFPVVVLNFDPGGQREPLSSHCNMRELDFHLGAFFGMLGANSTSRSVVFQQSMRAIGAFLQSARVQAVSTSIASAEAKVLSIPLVEVRAHSSAFGVTQPAARSRTAGAAAGRTSACGEDHRTQRRLQVAASVSGGHACSAST